MEIATQKEAYKEQSGLEKQVTHAVKQTLKLFNIFHAPWIILIEQSNDYKFKIYAFLPEKTTLPSGLNMPGQPISFNQTSNVPMREFTDVQFFPIARELAKEMAKAYQQGPQYRLVQ